MSLDNFIEGISGISILYWTLPDVKLAEGVRFELTRTLQPCRFSRPVHSTALPTFRLDFATST